jgi:hypothetical protein
MVHPSAWYDPSASWPRPAEGEPKEFVDRVTTYRTVVFSIAFLGWAPLTGLILYLNR